MTGTILNVATVLVGGTAGMALGQRLPDRIRETVMQGIGLVTIAVGLRMTSDSANILIVMGSILLGGILGEWCQIEDRLESLGDLLRSYCLPPFT